MRSWGLRDDAAEIGFLDFHHVEPLAAGGQATETNIALRCRAHNAHEASLCFSSGGVDVVREVVAAWR